MIRYRTPPWLIFSYIRILAFLFFRRGPKAKFPEGLAVTVGGLRTTRSELRSYNTLVGAAGSVDTIPVLFPHVMLSSTQIRLMSLSSFPYSILGAVHYRNRILQHATMWLDDTYVGTVTLRPVRLLEKGVEWEMFSTICVEGSSRVVWEELSVFYAKGRFTKTPSLPSAPLLVPLSKTTDRETTRTHEWRIPHSMGRAFGILTGDINPIHMHWSFAKLFGLPSDVAHGMCALGNLVHALEPSITESSSLPVEVQCAFKGPLGLGKNTTTSVVGNRLDMYIQGNELPVLLGKIETNSKTLSLKNETA